MLRKLRSFGVSCNVMELVYKSVIESLLSFNITVWFGNLSLANKNKLGRVVKNASKIVGKQQEEINSIYQRSIRKKAASIVLDNLHPLNTQFEILPSGKRYRVPRCRKNIFKKSFIPSAVAVLNSGPT